MWIWKILCETYSITDFQTVQGEARPRPLTAVIGSSSPSTTVSSSLPPSEPLDPELASRSVYLNIYFLVIAINGSVLSVLN